MISLKDYAAERNITYEAVRKSVVRYADELDGHITIVDRTQYLDDEAVAFLDEKRKKNPVVIIQQDKDEQIEQLRRENGELKDKLLAAQEAIIKKDERILNLTNENHALLAAGTMKQLGAGDPECQDETAIDVEPGDPESQQAAPEKKPGIRQRLRYLFFGQ